MDALDQQDRDNVLPVVVHRKSKKGSYRLVGLAPLEVEEEGLVQQDDDKSEQEVCHHNVTTATTRWNQAWTPDEPLEWRGIVILDLPANRFFKFLFWTAGLVTLIHYLARLLDWGYDTNYTMTDLMLYDGNLIVLDVMVFFCAGRLYRQPAVDCAGWQLVALSAAILSSWLLHHPLQGYSMSLYQMHCRWPWWLWVASGIVVPLCILVGWMHIRYAARHGIWLQKTVEGVLSFIIFVIPYASHPNFHLHHWYLGWLLGMHANMNIWWSRATMAACWGFYINGIATWGRDPILTCAISFYQSTNQHCHYMECYHDADKNGTAVDGSTYKPMAEYNWRNCSGYHP